MAKKQMPAQHKKGLKYFQWRSLGVSYEDTNTMKSRVAQFFNAF